MLNVTMGWFGRRVSAAILLGFVSWSASLQAAEGLNQLTEKEKAEGWKLLFDGETTEGWRGYRQKGFPAKGWFVKDGLLQHGPRAGGGDIITVGKYKNFELSWEWRLPPRANSGLKYFILEERGKAVGHEYQLIDDTVVRSGKGSTGSFYDVLPPDPNKPTKKPGEWNQSLIRVRGNQVEHWLNGVKILEYELGSETVKQAVAKSKFKDVPGFGESVAGHILLTDHQDEAAFRNLKIRELGP